MPGVLTLYSHRFTAMGTACALYIYAPDQVHSAMAFASAVAEVERIERKYSRFDPRSLVSAINRAGMAGGSIEMDDETAALVDYAFACHAKSEGLFDITTGLLTQIWQFSSGRLPDAKSVQSLLPRIGQKKLEWRRLRLGFRITGMDIDFGGLGKEYAVDRAASVLRDAGIHFGLVNFGGDITVLGPHPNGKPWIVGVRHPRRENAPNTDPGRHDHQKLEFAFLSR